MKTREGFILVAFLFLMLAFGNVLPARALGEELPVCADVAGVYLQAERAEPGARLLSSYLNSFTTVTARPYTDYSRSKLYIFQTIVSTPYAGNAPFIPYFEEVTQTAPYVFTDRKGVQYVFEVTDAGKVSSLRIDDVEWVPSHGLTSSVAINMTVLLLQLFCLYIIVALFLTVLYTRRHHRLCWRSLPATHLNTALTLCQTAALLTNAILLIWAVPALPYERLRIFFVLNILYMLALPLLGAGVILCAKRSELLTHQKIAYAINVVCALTLFALLLAWGLYH